MITIPACFYTPSILTFIDYCIEDGNTSFDDLSDADKDKLTASCIDALGEDAYSCIIEFNLMNTLNQFKNFIKTRSTNDSHELANIMNKNAQDYFREDMNALFEERSSQTKANNYINNGFFQYIDQHNGEIEWRKTA